MAFNESNDIDAIVNYTVEIFMDTYAEELSSLFDEQEEDIAQIEEDQEEPYIRGEGYSSWCQSIEEEAEAYAYRQAWNFFIDALGSDTIEIEEYFDSVVRRRIWTARYGNPVISYFSER